MVLGQVGFFDRFTVTMHRGAQVVVVEPWEFVRSALPRSLIVHDRGRSSAAEGVADGAAEGAAEGVAEGTRTLTF